MTKIQNNYQILLFYRYHKIQNIEKLKKQQIELCKKLDLKGRIIIAKEGINVTVGGLKNNTEKYIREMKKDGRFKNVDFKKSLGHENSFPRLSVKIKPEIVITKLGKDDVNPNRLTGKRLSPEKLQKWFSQNKKFKIIDMRNDYEYWFGHFKDSINPKMNKFRDLPKKLPKLKKYKNETVLTVCTGGVRCEKASGYLKKKGFKDVYQLDGGIVRYMEKYPGQNFLGSLFVFDDRQNIYFDKNHKTISKCIFCEKNSERMRNCANTKCNKKFVACDNCTPGDRSRYCKSCEKKFSKKLITV